MRLMVVALTLFFEARGEGDRGMRAAASVIWNRALAAGVADEETLERVCRKPFQFSPWNDGATVEGLMERALFLVADSELEAAAWRTCVALAADLVAGQFSPEGRWTHFCRTDVFPSWRAGMREQRFIGNHVFGRIG